jgi:hypothetical protein
MRRTSRVALILALLAPAACSSGFSLQNAAGTLVGDIDDLFGGRSPVVKRLVEIRDANERDGFHLRKDVEDSLDITRKAVRELGKCNYPTWSETALVVEKLSSMADEHESSLVRAECLDTLARVAPWVFSAAASTAPDHPSTEAEKFDAFKTLKEAVGKSDDDPALTAAATQAVATMTAFPFARVDPPSSAAGDNAAAARPYHRNLREARAALGAMTGRALLGFQGDPAMRDALELAYPALSSAVIRLTLIKAALTDASEPTRCAAIRDLATVSPAEGGPALRRVLVYDGSSSVRREAARALAAYPAAVSVPALIEGLADEMEDVRGAAASSLETITLQTFGDDRGAWLRWWQANAAKGVAAGAGK